MTYVIDHSAEPSEPHCQMPATRENATTARSWRDSRRYKFELILTTSYYEMDKLLSEIEQSVS